MAKLPDVTEDGQRKVDLLMPLLEQINELEKKLAEARDDRDGIIGYFLLNGWSLRQCALLSGYSPSQIDVIKKQQGIVTEPASARRADSAQA